jgi:hypothetical protein
MPIEPLAMVSMIAWPFEPALESRQRKKLLSYYIQLGMVSHWLKHNQIHKNSRHRSIPIVVWSKVPSEQNRWVLLLSRMSRLLVIVVAAAASPELYR